MWNNFKRTAALNIFVCGLTLAWGTDKLIMGNYWLAIFHLGLFIINALVWWIINKNNSLWLEQWMAQHHLTTYYQVHHSPPEPEVQVIKPAEVIKPEPKPINKYRDLDLGD